MASLREPYLPSDSHSPSALQRPSPDPRPEDLAAFRFQPSAPSLCGALCSVCGHLTCWPRTGSRPSWQLLTSFREQPAAAAPQVV
eukprot:7383223-Prymnesium_polylepis.1